MQSGGLGLVLTHLCPQFWCSKKNSKSTQFIELYLGFNQMKTSTTHWSGCRVQVWVQDWNPAGHLSIADEGYSIRQFKVWTQWTARSMAKLLEKCSGTAWAGLRGEHKHRVFPSLLQLLLATTGSLDSNMIPLLLFWLSYSVNKV